MQEIACHIMHEGEILNESHSEYPLYEGILYGGKVTTAKFSKRLSCSIRHLPLRLKFYFEYDILKAIETGVVKDPTLAVNGKIFLEGLVSAEDITKAFEQLI
jgi:hypothetical protein